MVVQRALEELHVEGEFDEPTADAFPTVAN
jgi:hypothetical protein